VKRSSCLTIPKACWRHKRPGDSFDLERGFIRAEVIHYNDLVASGSLAKGREVGKLRIEGKDYRVQDGDVLLIRFNV
jgi:ribosome-binding ATPase YchF (GTP1/OBG family)